MVKTLDFFVVCKIVTLRELGSSCKKRKKHWALNLDRQPKEFFENGILVGEKTSRPAREDWRKRAKTLFRNCTNSEEGPKNNIRTNNSTVKPFFNNLKGF